jgi:retinol dehydrogenase-14
VKGAQTSIYLASSPDVDGVTGQFFVNSKPKTANQVAYDADMTARLWDVSASLVGMSSPTA